MKIPPGSCFGMACRCGRKAGGIFIDSTDHRGEEWRLRAREVISAIGIQHAAVVFDLEEEVIDHVLAESFAMVGLESQKNEVTIPAVHLIEASARNDVGIRQIEQACSVQFL